MLWYGSELIWLSLSMSSLRDENFSKDRSSRLEILLKERSSFCTPERRNELFCMSSEGTESRLRQLWLRVLMHERFTIEGFILRAEGYFLADIDILKLSYSVPSHPSSLLSSISLGWLLRLWSASLPNWEERKL